MTIGSPGSEQRSHLHPVLIVLAMLVLAVLLTHLIPAGRFERHEGRLVPGSYHAIAQQSGLPAFLSPVAPAETEAPARSAGVVALFAAMPIGVVRSASLIFMVMFIGGTFGVLRATGAIDAGVDRIMQLTSGNVYLLTIGLMLILSCGSTFLGFSSEYVAIIPLVLGVGQRLRLPNLFAPALVALSDFIGYAASVTNPIALGVAQPLAEVPVFSGVFPRLMIFTTFLGLGVGYVLLYLRHQPKDNHIPEAARLTGRHAMVLLCLVLGSAALAIGTSVLSWQTSEHSSVFIALGMVLAVAGGLRAGAAADAFLDGMKTMLLPAVLIGVSGGIGIILQSSQVMDSIVEGIATMLAGHAPGTVATLLMATEMVFGTLITSVSAKAAVTMPIVAPIAHLAGVSGQTTVTALLLGSGMTNMISPTNPLLLAFLVASRVGYGEWARFIAPLFLLFSIIGFSALYILATLGY